MSLTLPAHYGRALGKGLAEALEAAGHRVWADAAGLHAENEPAAQALIDTHDPLPAAKRAKVAAIRAECVTRSQGVFDAIDSAGEVELLANLWLSIAPAARNPTADMTRFLAIANAARTAIVAVRAATTEAGVAAVTPAWPA